MTVFSKNAAGALLILAAGGSALPAALPESSIRVFLIAQLRVTLATAAASPDGIASADGYISIENRGLAPDRLIAARSTEADEVSLKVADSAGSDDAALSTIPPGGRLDLRPDSLHLVFQRLRHPLREGDHFDAVIEFERAGPLAVEFAVGRPLTPDDQPGPGAR